MQIIYDNYIPNSNEIQTTQVITSHYVTNPNNAHCKGKPSELPYMLASSIWPPKKNRKKMGPILMINYPP